MEQAQKIHRDGKAFALAIYCGGLAVECLLRAFRWTQDPGFEGRHDLSELLRSSRLLRINDEYMRRKKATEEETREATLRITEAMNEVIILWRNNLRFASEASLKAFLKSIERYQGVKGDPLKKNASDLLSAAQTVIERGTILWKSERRS
jgi:hypothetical protein